LGESPVSHNGKIQFFVRHSHEIENCEIEDLQHSLV
jgi:zinc transport system ATP-binding protein